MGLRLKVWSACEHVGDITCFRNGTSIYTKNGHTSGRLFEELHKCVQFLAGNYENVKLEVE